MKNKLESSYFCWKSLTLFSRNCWEYTRMWYVHCAHAHLHKCWKSNFTLLGKKEKISIMKIPLLTCNAHAHTLCPDTIAQTCAMAPCPSFVQLLTGGGDLFFCTPRQIITEYKWQYGVGIRGSSKEATQIFAQHKEKRENGIEKICVCCLEACTSLCTAVVAVCARANVLSFH